MEKIPRMGYKHKWNESKINILILIGKIKFLVTFDESISHKDVFIQEEVLDELDKLR